MNYPGDGDVDDYICFKVSILTFTHTHTHTPKQTPTPPMLTLCTCDRSVLLLEVMQLTKVKSDLITALDREAPGG